MAIFQKNTNASQTTIETTLQQFYQNYNDRQSLGPQSGLDKSMVDIATKLGVAPPAVSSKYEDGAPPPASSSIFALRRAADKEPKAELDFKPDGKTRVAEEGPPRQRRAKPQLPALALDTAKRADDEHFEV